MDPVELLKDLVAIPSVNPMGRDVTGPEYLEGRVTEYLLAFFNRLGVPHEAMEVSPGRHNVLARLEIPGARTTIVLDAHQDTVPVEGMTIAPFDPVIENGRLYGRGSCDVKGGMASNLAAFARLVADQPKSGANVVISCTCDEEAGASGALALAKRWNTPSLRGGILPAVPDMVIAAEPTNLDVVVAHKGAVRWKLKTHGRAAHSSRPQEGVNAVYKMAQVLGVLEKYAAELPQMVPEHALCGKASLSVGRIEGGISVNTVPNECTIEIDRRVLPDEDASEAIPHVTQYLRERLDVDFENVPPWLSGMTLSDRHNGPWADRLLRHITKIVGPRKKIGVPFGTNASRFATQATPSLVFGPGSIDQAHTKDEWISIDELRQAADVVYSFCAHEGTPA